MAYQRLSWSCSATRVGNNANPIRDALQVSIVTGPARLYMRVLLSAGCFEIVLEDPWYLLLDIRVRILACED